MDASTEEFIRLRPRLLGLAYRMLGSLAEAEDVVQDVWLGWHAADQQALDSAEAWLVTTTTRRAIDHLRRVRHDREKYVGMWLPEPVITYTPETPEQRQEAASDLSVAFLTLLERLAPDARAAYLLREVLDQDYADIARTLDKTEAACRQIVHRAKSQLREEQPRYVVSAEAHQRLMRRFVQAWQQADFSGMRDLMAESATLIGDGGGVVTSFPAPMVGGERIAQLLFASTLRPEQGMRVELAWINGRLGVLRYFGDVLESVHAMETDGQHITRILVQRNPDKLRSIQAHRITTLN